MVLEDQLSNQMMTLSLHISQSTLTVSVGNTTMLHGSIMHEEQIPNNISEEEIGGQEEPGTPESSLQPSPGEICQVCQSQDQSPCIGSQQNETSRKSQRAPYLRHHQLPATKSLSLFCKLLLLQTDTMQPGFLAFQTSGVMFGILILVVTFHSLCQVESFQPYFPDEESLHMHAKYRILTKIC